MPMHDWTKVDSGGYHHFHQRWCGSICDALNDGRMPKGYYALVDQRARGLVPDVLTLKRKPKPGEGIGAGGAVTATTPSTRFVSVADQDLYAARANRVAVRNPFGEVVALIEIVSPGNKSSRDALRTFVRKVQGFLRAGVHFLIIDPFPPTRRDPHGVHPAVWRAFRDEPFELPPDKPLTLAAYSASDVLTAYVEPFAVGDELRDMPVFLEGDAHVAAPLEATYRATWDLCPEPLREAVTGAA